MSPATMSPAFLYVPFASFTIQLDAKQPPLARRGRRLFWLELLVCEAHRDGRLLPWGEEDLLRCG